MSQVSSAPPLPPHLVSAGASLPLLVVLQTPRHRPKTGALPSRLCTPPHPGSRLCPFHFPFSSLPPSPPDLYFSVAASWALTPRRTHAFLPTPHPSPALLNITSKHSSQNTWPHCTGLKASGWFTGLYSVRGPTQPHFPILQPPQGPPSSLLILPSNCSLGQSLLPS